MPALNPDLPLSWTKPGTYIGIDYAGAGSGANDISRRLLILGERLSSGARGADALYRVQSAADVFTNAGRGSTVARAYQAAMSQGAIPGEVWIGQVNAPSAGTAATHQFKVYGPATAAGSLTVWIAGYAASAGYVSGDSASTIATALKAQLDLLVDLPVTFGIATDVITMTYRHKGVIGEDLRRRSYVTPGTGVKIGPGDFVYASAAVGAGTATLTAGTTTITASLSGGEAADAVAAAVNSAINATEYCVWSEVTTSTLSVYDRNDKDVGRVKGKIVTSTGTTINVNGIGAVAAGTDAPNGITGAGAPTLTTLIATIAASPGFGTWLVPWTDSASLGAIAAHIKLYADGLRQRNQKAITCSTASLATAGAVLTAPTPTLIADNVSERWTVLHSPDAHQQGYELAARMAAARAANSTPAKRWIGTPVQSDGIVPLLAPSLPYSDADVSAAIGTYYLAPITNVDGVPTLAIGRTCSPDRDQVLWHWATTDQLDRQRAELVASLTAFVDDKMLKASGVASSPGVIDTDAVEEFHRQELRRFEAEGYFDNADALAASVDYAINPSNATRLDGSYTASVLIVPSQVGVLAIRGFAPQGA